MLLHAAEDPVDVVPLSMLVISAVQAAQRADRPSRILLAAQFAYGLQRLGFEAELFEAEVTILREDLPTASPVSFGSSAPPCLVPAAGDDRGIHLVVLTRTFNVMIDPGVFVDPRVSPLFAGLDESVGVPPMLNLQAAPLSILLGAFPAIRRGPLLVTWQFNQAQSRRSDEVPCLDLARVEHGGMVLATAAVDLLAAAALGNAHSGLYARYPQLRPSTWPHHGGQQQGRCSEQT